MANIQSYQRRKTSTTWVGRIAIGSDYPIRIQTMANTNTNDIDASVAQAIRCREAGAEILRYTTQGLKEVESLGLIHKALQAKGIDTLAYPLVADIHFRSDVADAAALLTEKVRVNPGNYAAEAELEPKFRHLMDLCREHHTAIRIGVNHGSLSQRIMNQYGDTPEGIVASCMEFLRLAVSHNFHDIVLSIKASNTRVMVDSVRLLVQAMDKEDMHFPLHLGVTEAGEGEDGRIKSAVGIGALLSHGIGDTIRVSLSEEPEAEIPVATALRDYFTDETSPRYNGNDATISNQKVTYIGSESDWSLFCLHAAAECGHLLWDNGCNELEIHATDKQIETILQQSTLAADILQAARIRMYKTDYISCPGCGRTMFDLQKTVAEIKSAIADIQDEKLREKIATLKIGVMGCIVNGPGEMADADYGYVGAGRDKISLYRGKQCIERAIPQTEAVARLIQIIQQD